MNENAEAHKSPKTELDGINDLENLRNSVGIIESAEATANEIVSALNRARGVAEADVLAISTAKNGFEKLHGEVQGASDEAAAAYTVLQKEIEAISLKRDSLEGVVAEITKIKESAEKALLDVSEKIAQIKSTHEDVVEIKDDISDEVDDLKEQKENLISELDETKKKYDQVTLLLQELFEDKVEIYTEVDSAGNPIQRKRLLDKSMKGKILELFQIANEEYADVKAVCAQSKTHIRPVAKVRGIPEESVM
jgi:chromosome segregation ATPase